MLTAMRFKDYTWPHNPRTYAIEYRRDVDAQKVPFAHYYMQDLGLAWRVMSGEGEFVGDGAYDEFRKLANVFYSPGSGMLIHPVWQPSKAHFVKLELTQQPRSDYVAYRFEFWEDTEKHAPGVYSKGAGTAVGGGSGKAAGSATHTVRAGETMTTIAAQHSTTAAELIKKNPTVRQPNLLRIGQEICIN